MVNWLWQKSGVVPSDAAKRFKWVFRVYFLCHFPEHKKKRRKKNTQMTIISDLLSPFDNSRVYQLIQIIISAPRERNRRPCWLLLGEIRSSSTWRVVVIVFFFFFFKDRPWQWWETTVELAKVCLTCVRVWESFFHYPTISRCRKKEWASFFFLSSNDATVQI